MAQDQMKKTLADGVTGEQLQAVIGTNADEGETPKEAIMKLLKDAYGIEEEDFAAAELELVPAMKSRDVGFDRSLIASYGQDDRVCSYANMKAIFDAKPGTKTQAALLTDKEEIGSYGNTGMESSYFVKFVMKLLALQGRGGLLDFYETMEASEMLSADVNSCLDPMFAEVSEKTTPPSSATASPSPSTAAPVAKRAATTPTPNSSRRSAPSSTKPAWPGRSANSAKSTRAAAAPSPS